ncbi:hypothetical protein DERF_008523 [Dermatophagoides farinae]|uniref:Uncharacterized protein n=1 Tax=Dermatophagoides farinae TaxID=6954 RepID=A0A922I2K9_DERFA|nr:hypothetical protein DERF_008523 [Dermatophagoides farinae]
MDKSTHFGMKMKTRFQFQTSVRSFQVKESIFLHVNQAYMTAQFSSVQSFNSIQSCNYFNK